MWPTSHLCLSLFQIAHVSNDYLNSLAEDEHHVSRAIHPAPPPPGASFTVNIKLSTFQCKIIYKNSSNKDGNVIIIQRRRSKFDNGMQCLFVCLQQESSTKAAVGVGGVCSPWGTLGWGTAPLCGCRLSFHGRRRVIFGYNNDQLFIADFFYLAEYNIFWHFGRTINILYGTIMYFNVNSYVRITISKFLSIFKAFSSLSMFKPYN